MRGPSPAVASGGHSPSRCAGLSLSRPPLLRSTGSRRAGSVIVAHGHSRSAACGILPDQGSNPRPLHWQADSQPLRHQGSPSFTNSFQRFVRFLVNTMWILCVNRTETKKLTSEMNKACGILGTWVVAISMYVCIIYTHTHIYMYVYIFF